METIVPVSFKPTAVSDRSPLDGLSRRILFSMLRLICKGRLILEEGSFRWVFGEQGADDVMEARVRVHSPGFYSNIVFGGTIGAGESYMAGEWSADDLTLVMRLMVKNQGVFNRFDGRWSWSGITDPVFRRFHARRSNTLRGSRKNIAAHYDLGNDFYALFLDRTMTYSCAFFETEATSLEEASLAKYERICRKLGISSQDHVLEIGTGWGGFAEYAAGEYGCRVTTTTISLEQYSYARERVRRAGLSDRIEPIMKDYRHLEGLYDKLVSIEMIEAVGFEFLDEFFRCCGRLLKEDGMMALQSITIADQVYENHKETVDFIKRYIFPGGCIPSVTALCDSATRASDLRLVHMEDIGSHYAVTLRRWRENFFSNIDQVRALGYPEAFIRMWEYYLCYCEGGFAERYLGDVQMVFHKPGCREPLRAV